VDKITSLKQLVPLSVSIQECDTHAHILLGVIGKEPPYPEQQAFYNAETEEYFYPFGEFIQCQS
jgi:hypothetical protein